jgi:hypothetical protein
MSGIRTWRGFQNLAVATTLSAYCNQGKCCTFLRVGGTTYNLWKLVLVLVFGGDHARVLVTSPGGKLTQSTHWINIDRRGAIQL